MFFSFMASISKIVELKTLDLRRITRSPYALPTKTAISSLSFVLSIQLAKQPMEFHRINGFFHKSKD